MFVEGIGWEGVGWIVLAQYRDTWWPVIDAVMNIWVPSNVGNFLSR